MDLTLRYRPAGSRIIHEVFENEVVVVNLDSGRYYCVQDAGADIWHLMLEGQTLGAMAAGLTSRYDASDTEIAEAIGRLCQELCDEGLLVVAEGAADAPRIVPHEQPRRRFAPPRLQTYTDMQDLLLLDPIHEVDAAGWPRARDDESGPSR